VQVQVAPWATVVQNHPQFFFSVLVVVTPQTVSVLVLELFFTPPSSTQILHGDHGPYTGPATISYVGELIQGVKTLALKSIGL